MLHRESQNQPQGSVPSRTKSLENAGMCFSSTARKSMEITNTRPVVAVKVSNPINGKFVKTYAMLDGGSEFSIMDRLFPVN